MTVAQGTRLGHYTIVSPLGEGGMGEVWLAEDTTLKRKVALKVLPAGVATDPDRLARFQREAEAVAALSHPNIVTIHSIEQDGDVRFLTMERVEGQSLDQVIPRGGLPLGPVLEIGATLADALAASHETGIIHRDLKPANIMLAGRERRVKVLDFGLAKLREEAASDGETTTAALSGEGRILGTVAYMSPEQAEGKPVDPRSDLFSLGIVLYEMASGERPFKGDTSLSVLSAILRDTPKSVTELRADLPRELGRIVRRCLQKDPEQRYQTAKDLRNDLQLLKADLGSGDLPAVEFGARPAPGPRPGRLLRWLAVGVGAVALAAAAAGMALRFGMFTRAPASRPFESIRLTQLTDSGRAGVAAISPDGRYLAYSAQDAAGREVLLLRQLATGSEVQIAPTSVAATPFDVTFTPDAQFLYYVSFGRAPVAGEIAPRALYRLPTLGGASHRILDGVTWVRVSPDGGRLAYVKIAQVQSTAAWTLCTARVDATDERCLATRKDPESLSHVAWSPDGNRIATLARAQGGSSPSILVFDLAGGSSRSISAGTLRLSTSGLAWLPDGFLVVAAEGREGSTAESQLWLVSDADGHVRRVTHDLNAYYRVSVTADGRTIVASLVFDRANIWIVSSDDPRQPRAVTFSRQGGDGALGLDWTPDDRIVFATVAGADGAGIWSVRADGAELRRLTSSAGYDMFPAVSPDGRVVVFMSRLKDRTEAWRMDTDGGSARLLARIDPGTSRISFTPDGNWLLGSSEHDIWKMPATGGEPTPVLAGDSSSVPPQFWPRAVSPDERSVWGTFRRKADSPALSGAIVSIDGRQRWRELKLGDGALSTLCWTRDGKALSYSGDVGGSPPGHPGSNILVQAVAGGPGRQVTAFTDEAILSHAWSRDGRRLAVSRATQASDLVMITDEKKRQ